VHFKWRLVFRPTPDLHKGDGSRVSFELTIVPMLNEAGRMEGMAAISRDLAGRFEEMRTLRREIAAAYAEKA
jgi:hypothetical protein